MTNGLPTAGVVIEFIRKHGETHDTYGTFLSHSVRLELLHHLLGMSDLLAVILVSLAMRLLAGYVAVVDRPACCAYLEVGADPAAGAARL